MKKRSISIKKNKKKRSILRPTDILVFEWIRGKHACVNHKGFFSCVFEEWGFHYGAVYLKVVSCKMAKYKKAHMKNQQMLIPFVFDTFGLLVLYVVEFPNRV